jgi:colanic acid/amylovoran biosynthesis glycosyltransferase
MKPLALHSVNPFLFGTGSWVYGQIRGLERWRAAVVCKRRENAEQFPFDAVFALADLPAPQQWLEQARKAVTGSFPFMERVAKRESARVLHSHFAGKGWQDIALARATGLPHVSSFYGADIWRSSRSPKWRARYEALWSAGDLFLVEGGAMRAKVASLGCPLEKIVVQHLGVDVSAVNFAERVAPADGVVKVLICGRAVEKKGHELALRIFAAARREMPNLRLSVMVIAKSDEERALLARLHAVVRELDLGAVVDFPPPLPYAAWRKSLESYHIFLAPSLHASDGDAEGGAPVTLIDMSATGIPIVASKHCDIPEVSPHGVSGLLFEENDVVGGAAALLEAARSPQNWREWGRAGRAHVEANYSQKRQIGELERIYDRLAAGSRGAT